MATTLKKLIESTPGELIYVYAYGAIPGKDSPYIVYGERLLGSTDVTGPQGVFTLKEEPPEVIHLFEVHNTYVFMQAVEACPLPADPSLGIPSAEVDGNKDGYTIPGNWHWFNVRLMADHFGCSLEKAEYIIAGWLAAGQIRLVQSPYRQHTTQDNTYVIIPSGQHDLEPVESTIS